MTWLGGTVLAVALFSVLAVRRRRTLAAKWSWNDVAIQVNVGMRLTEIYVAEVRGVSADAEHLVFETTRGALGIESRWVVPNAVTMLTAACGQTRAGIVRALNSPRRTELWRGEAGTFRVPHFTVSVPSP